MAPDYIRGHFLSLTGRIHRLCHDFAKSDEANISDFLFDEPCYLSPTQKPQVKRWPTGCDSGQVEHHALAGTQNGLAARLCDVGNQGRSCGWAHPAGCSGFGAKVVSNHRFRDWADSFLQVRKPDNTFATPSAMTPFWRLPCDLQFSAAVVMRKLWRQASAEIAA